MGARLCWRLGAAISRLIHCWVGYHLPGSTGDPEVIDLIAISAARGQQAIDLVAVWATRDRSCGEHISRPASSCPTGGGQILTLFGRRVSDVISHLGC